MSINNSVFTNASAFTALRSLNKINERLDTTQGRVSTGLKVASSLDDASAFAVAQGIRAEVRALDSVIQGLNNSKAVGKVAVAGATAVSNLMIDIRQKLTELANGGLTTAQRVIVKADFDKLMSQAYGFVSNSNFNGRNLLISDATNVNTISNLNGTNLTLTARSGSNSGVTHLIRSLAGATLGTTGAATDAVNAQSVIAAQYSALETEVNTSLGALGAEIRALKFQTDFLTTVNDSTEIGLGNIVDADLARESAELTALQVRQQLGVQVLGIANQQPQILLNLLGN